MIRPKSRLRNGSADIYIDCRGSAALTNRRNQRAQEGQRRRRHGDLHSKGVWGSIFWLFLKARISNGRLPEIRSGWISLC